MKINKLLLLFALPLSLISCGNSISVTKEEKNNIIDKLIDNVYVEAHAYQDLIYPKEYASYSSKSEYHFQRQYSTFMDNNKEIEAVRFIKGSKTVTYFEGSTGKAYYQVFDQNGNIKNVF